MESDSNRRPATKPSPFLQPQNPSPSNKNSATILELKDLAASRANSIKRCLDLCHSEILKEIEASNSRLSKRFKANFDLGNNEKLKRWVFIAISRSWRNWKATLKKNYYKPYHIIRERLLHCPARVNPDQWASLVTFWGSQEGVARSKRNSINREAQTMSHMAGIKSFARIRDEARARNPDGQVPDRMEVFQMTHTRRDGQLVDQASRDVMVPALLKPHLPTVASYHLRKSEVQ